MKSMLKASRTKRLKLKHEEVLSTFAFNFKLRRYTKENKSLRAENQNMFAVLEENKELKHRLAMRTQAATSDGNSRPATSGGISRPATSSGISRPATSGGNSRPATSDGGDGGGGGRGRGGDGGGGDSVASTLAALAAAYGPAPGGTQAPFSDGISSDD
jgi:hypothetical protein